METQINYLSEVLFAISEKDAPFIKIKDSSRIVPQGLPGGVSS